ncbi:expressed unknown protein [Seminavis robusta]|uniref:Uncharacterized protein n=1 Tax=Seminavis robusta TaxID=568900 RepID=A0A9N8H7C2_9STRA|nr:expressed unknown protein [Seminavis robusta]|eukprot:Sro174_g076650.1 n/a (265) ;mRNA; f:44276-45167
MRAAAVVSRVSSLAILLVSAVSWSTYCQAFTSIPRVSTTEQLRVASATGTPTSRLSACGTPHQEGDIHSLSRRSLFLTAALSSSLFVPTPAVAAGRVPLEESLYYILRVREATQQESRLIKSGKFRDVQRANVKLAVKFMIENYRLGDSFVAASSYLDGNDRRVAAVNVGQSAVQDLYTILEYFDASDVQNLKIGSSSLSSDKESVVLKGLEATRKTIDDFLAYFPQDTVNTVKRRVTEENDLNFKEFDRSLGDIVNPNPAQQQ